MIKLKATAASLRVGKQRAGLLHNLTFGRAYVQKQVSVFGGDKYLYYDITRVRVLRVRG